MAFSQIVTQIVGFCIAFVVARWAWQVFFSPLKDLPGPFPAKFSNFYRAFAALRGHIDTTNVQLHRKYGPIVRVGPNCVSVGDPNLIRTIYQTKNPWMKSEMYRPNDVLINGQLISNVFNTQDEDWHSKYMRPIRGLWSMSKVLEYEPLIDETLKKFVNKLDTKFVGGKVCPADEWLGYFAWDVTANISFGRHYGFIDQEKDVNNLIIDSTKGLYYFATVSQIPWIDRLLDKNPIVRIGPKPTLTGVLYAFQVCGEYQAELASKQQKAGNVAHTLDKYVALKETYPDIANDPQIVNWLMLSILAGGDTTSATMRAIVYYLAKNTAAKSKLQAELDKAQLSLPAQWKDVNGLPYLDAVIREGLRINPGIAMIFERVVPETGFKLPDSGVFLPPGTKVGVNPAVTNRDFKVFGDDADAYNPDRWLQKEGESPAEFETRSRRMRDVADFTFGGGGRVCMGRYLAALELYKLFATLYSIYDIDLVDAKHEWKYYDAWFVYQWDMPMTIKRRSHKMQQ